MSHFPRLTAALLPLAALAALASAAGRVSVFLPAASRTPIPNTGIDEEPSNPTSGTDATFHMYAGPGDVVKHYECQLDAGSWVVCPNPKTYTGLATGTHTFSARACNQAAPPRRRPTARIRLPLRYGMRGRDVLEVQRLLSRHRLPTRVTGVYGRQTARNVERFQRSVHLRHTGVVDRRTLARLRPLAHTVAPGVGCDRSPAARRWTVNADTASPDGGDGSPVPGAGEYGQYNGLTPTKLVSTTGSDGNACTLSAPCRTISRAASVAGPGDVVGVQDGSYAAPGIQTQAGTSSARLTFVAQHRWGAKIGSNGTGNGTSWDVRGVYVDVVGFDISGDPDGGLALNASYDRAILNHVHDIPTPQCGSGTGLGAGNGNDVPSAYASHDQQILYNVVENIGPSFGSWGPGTPKCALVQGIYAGVPNVKVIGNLALNVVANGISTWHSATHLTVVNNTVANTGWEGILIGCGDQGCSSGNTGSYVANNVVADSRQRDMAESGRAGGNTYVDNTLYGGTTSCGIVCTNPSGGSRETGTLTSDPVFVGGDDYALQASSPSVNSGTSQGAPSADLDGDPRPRGGGYDRGAYER
jgi:pectate disaccharide-lyase